MIWNTSFVFIRHREHDNGAVIFALNECPLYWFDRLLYHHSWRHVTDTKNEESVKFNVEGGGEWGKFCVWSEGILSMPNFTWNKKKKKKNFAFGMRKFCVWEEYEAEVLVLEAFTFLGEMSLPPPPPGKHILRCSFPRPRTASCRGCGLRGWVFCLLTFALTECKWLCCKWGKISDLSDF